LHAILRGGPVFYVFDSPPGDGQGTHLNAYYLELNVSHQLTDFFSHPLILQRSLRQRLNQGSDYIQEFVAGYSLFWLLTQSINISANFAYTHGIQPFDVLVDAFPFGSFTVQSTENYDRYAAELSASWQATERTVVRLGYSHWVRTSDIPGRGYVVNILSLSV